MLFLVPLRLLHPGCMAGPSSDSSSGKPPPLPKSGASTLAESQAAVGGEVSAVAPPPPAAKALPDEAIVVRGGVATPKQIAEGIGPHRDVEGLTGFSAQSRAGATVEELASTGGVGGGPFPHGQVSVSSAGQLRGVGADVVPSPGAGANHVTVTPGQATPAPTKRAIQATPKSCETIMIPMRQLYADFNDLAEDGTLPLTCSGSIESIAQTGPNAQRRRGIMAFRRGITCPGAGLPVCRWLVGGSIILGLRINSQLHDVRMVVSASSTLEIV